MPRVHPRRAQSPHALSLRPPRGARATDRAPAPGAALPHAHPVVFPEGHAEKHFINWQQDPEANYLARFVFPEKTRELRIEVDLVAEMAVLNPFDFFLEPYAETFPFAYQGVDKRDLAPYLVMFRGEPKFREYLATISRDR